ncbi:hypothetical protein KocCE7_12670 (plasmid) [Kocuria marina subsp. indica]|uniref:hypothetical protein n=1 Tax=Kocuria marina TaxID=223184 RepID=UPI00103AB9D5|nr:hypothetical protein [Kocuria indica]QBJ22751.1 hypothetical protein KocCE7_12670 [Kocuria indica]
MTDKANKMRRPSRTSTTATSNTTPDMASAFTARREETRKLTAVVSKDRYDKLRRIAFERDTSITQLINEAIDKLS